ncbi:hypothetical protein BVC80_9001g4 [Macleaya cordata]|uniref:Uncharacterized protein n=1 Tax=Macleaya cordata TaxID=56857 RepID=A0A200QLZ3_MACCD|nr:hypothetical protein BVC80_9001g4 [Macleaya cordata]
MGLFKYLSANQQGMETISKARYDEIINGDDHHQSCSGNINSAEINPCEINLPSARESDGSKKTDNEHSELDTSYTSWVVSYYIYLP